MCARARVCAHACTHEVLVLTFGGNGKHTSAVRHAGQDQSGCEPEALSMEDYFAVSRRRNPQQQHCTSLGLDSPQEDSKMEDRGGGGTRMSQISTS